MPALQYNADVERYWFFLRWKHTVFPMVMRDPVFWTMLLFHSFIIYKQQELLAEGDSLPDLNWKASSLLWSLLTFFVVFYGGNCFNRYFTFYGACTGMGGCLGEWGYLVRAHFDASPPSVKWNIVRLLLAAMELQLASLGGSDDSGGKGLDEEEWERIRRHGLLGRDEISRLQKYKGSKPFLPAVWALGEVRSALKAKLSKLSPSKAELEKVRTLPSSELAPPEAKPPPPMKKPSASAEHEAESVLLHTPAAMAVFEDFETCVLKFKSHCGASTNLLKMPVPFAYFHVLKLLLMISLALTSYALVELEHAQVFISMLVFLVICFIMIGLQAVAVAMSDPFGSDDIDFDLDKFFEGAYNNCIALVTDQRIVNNDRLPPDMDPNYPLADTDAARRARTWKGALGEMEAREAAFIAGGAGYSLYGGSSSSPPGAGGATRKALPTPAGSNRPQQSPKQSPTKSASKKGYAQLAGSGEADGRVSA